MQIVRQRKVLQKHASRSRSFRFFVIGLILVGEMTVSFTGGLIVGNPWLPNYLVDRINGRSQGVANANIKAPPAPSTAVDYLNLMNYDEKALTRAERSVAAILNDTVVHLDIGKPPFQIFSEQVLPKIETVQPGEDLTKIRAAVQQCQDIADSAVHYYQDVSAQLTTKLKAAGVPASTASETATTFAKWAQEAGKVPWPTEVNKACASITTLLDVLSANSSQWTRQADGHLLFTSQQLWTSTTPPPPTSTRRSELSMEGEPVCGWRLAGAKRQAASLIERIITILTVIKIVFRSLEKSLLISGR